jgi:Short C-terminal domain
MNLADEIERLRRLHAQGALSDEEFARAKGRVLQGQDGANTSEGPRPPGDAAPGEGRHADRTPPAVRLPGLLSLVGLVGGGVVGGHDGGWPGVAVGCVAGLVAGALAGWALRCAVLVLRPVAALTWVRREPPSPGRRTAGRVGGALGLALCLALGWELYWAANLAVLAADAVVGVRLAREQPNPAGDEVRQVLRSERWLAELAAVRPLRWVQTDAVAGHNAATRDLVAAVLDPAATLDLDRPLGDAGVAGARRRFLRLGGHLADGVNDRTLRAYAAAFDRATTQEMSEVLGHTLLLRRLPVQRLLPKAE